MNQTHGTVSPLALAIHNSFGRFRTEVMAAIQQETAAMFGGAAASLGMGGVAALPGSTGRRGRAPKAAGAASTTGSGNARSNSEEVHALIGEMVRVLQAQPQPLTKRQLHEGCASKPSDGQLTYALNSAKAAGVIVQQGEKRNAVYLASPDAASKLVAGAVSAPATAAVATPAAAPVTAAPVTPAATDSAAPTTKAAAAKKAPTKKAAVKKAPAKKSAPASA